MEERENAPDTLIEIAKKRACLLKGGEYDYDKAAGFVLDDFRNGRLGRITLEIPEMISGAETALDGKEQNRTEENPSEAVSEP